MTRCLHRWQVDPAGINRRCLDCYRVETLPENAEPWDPPPSERLRAPEWYPATIETPEPVPHIHEWERIVTTTFGDEIWQCRACGVRETITAGFSPPEVRSSKFGKRTLVEEHGGIVGYDPRTELITTGDGTSFTVEALMSVNPGISMTDLTYELERVHDEQQKTKELQEKVKSLTEMTLMGGVAAEDFAKALGKLSTAVADMPSVSRNPAPPRRWTSDDALTLILEEIKHAPDPMKAAGEWITKMTNAITGIIRDLDDEQ
jgi:hypothetical protein